jgi:small-conductance mechanosensitive channel
MIFQNYFDFIQEWLSINLLKIFIISGAIIVGYIIYIVIKRQLNSLRKHDKLKEVTAKNLSRLAKFITLLVVFSVIIMQFAESVGIVAALLTVIGGTIIGFAAMNTIGNMIAGLIIMVSKPFSIGDRINYEDRVADIIDITLIYTIMEDLDGVEIYVPNQKLLNTEILNYGKNGNIIRRSVKITPGFDEDRLKVEKALLEAAKKVPAVLEHPKPYVWVHNFLDYAVEYTLFVFIKQISAFPEIDSELHKVVLDTVNEYGIDISTPLLLKQISK